MPRAPAAALLSLALGVPLVLGAFPEASAFVEGKVCIKFPVYQNLGINIDDPRCQRWACTSVVTAGRAFYTEACRNMTAYPASSVVYARAALTPAVPLQSFVLAVKVRDLSQPSVVFADCVWSHAGAGTGAQLFLDSCLRNGGSASNGPWVFDPSFQSEPEHPDDPNTAYALLTLYVGLQPGACAATKGVGQCAGVP